MTKLVTSIAVMMLVDEGKVRLDAPFADYWPEFKQPEVLEHFDPGSGMYQTRPAQSAITVRQLLTHTSGYGYWFLNSYLMRLNDGVPNLFEAPFLLDEPGAQFLYGTSTDVLGQMIEPVAGLSLAEFFSKRIFVPLGMRDTSFNPPANADRLASIFVRTANEFDEQPNEKVGAPARGGGGLYSTADNYCRLLRLLLNHGEHQGQRLLSEAACEEITRNQIGDLTARRPTTAFASRSNDFIFMNDKQKFGLGVSIESSELETGRPQGSYGWAGIYNTYYWVDPKNAMAAAIFMQVQPFADPQCVTVCQSFERALYQCLA